MKKRGFLYLVLPALVFLVLVVGFVFMRLPTAVAQEPPPERPQPPPGRTEPPEVGPGPIIDSDRSEGISPVPCSDICGVIINWGYRNEPKLPIDLRGGGLQTLKFTDDNGYYAFQCLGIGVGLLNLVLPPGLSPMTTDVAIRLGYQEEFEVNLGLYGGEVVPSLHVTPTMTVSDVSVLPGGTLTYTIQVTNTLGPLSTGRKMEDAMVTDLLPECLTSVEVTSTVGTLELWGNLLTADIGELAPGQAVTITVKATVGEDVLPTSIIANQASLFHGGNVTVQTAPITVEVKAAHKP